MTLVHPHSRLPIASRRFAAASPSGFQALSPQFRSNARVSNKLALSSRSSSLPFPPEKAPFHRELSAAVDVVERACRLCVDVKRSLLSNDRRVLEKNDQTPVTIADFSVQALISLELGRLFPAIPLVAEEDSAVLRSGDDFLVKSVLAAVSDKVRSGDKGLSSGEVLNAIDRGGKDAVAFGAEPATYWVLDPIDGTRGFLKGSDALYVVGLALVVEGKIALGVMGCPNWKEDFLFTKGTDDKSGGSVSGILMAAHIGCGTWTKSFSKEDGDLMKIQDFWKRCFVDSCRVLHDARFCIPDSQTWESMPLTILFGSKVDSGDVKEEKVHLLPTCCGSLCKYMMVASGRASVFILRARVQTLIKVWDHAAGAVCVNEAGGQITDWRGSPLDLAADEVERRIIFPSGGVLITNGKLHKQLLEMISSNS